MSDLNKLKLVESNNVKLVQLLDDNDVVVKVTEYDKFFNNYEMELEEIGGTHAVTNVTYIGRWRHSHMDWSGYLIKLKLHEFKTCKDSYIKLMICDFYVNDEGQKDQLRDKLNDRNIKVKDIDLVYSLVRTSLNKEPEEKEGLVLDVTTSRLITESEFNERYGLT